MLPFHERLARIGLNTLADDGFVLAGGYALSGHGIGNRPSEDVDLFTNNFSADEFAQAADRLIEALRSDKLIVDISRQGKTFLDVYVKDLDTNDASAMQLGVNFREFPPARIEVGPVLDLRDAVASKMSALWSRGYVRDFIDIDKVVESGAFSKDQVLSLADSQEATPMDRHMLADRFRQAAYSDPEEYASYGVNADDYAALAQRFTQWADEIDPPTPTAPENP